MHARFSIKLRSTFAPNFRGVRYLTFSTDDSLSPKLAGKPPDENSMTDTISGFIIGIPSWLPLRASCGRSTSIPSTYTRFSSYAPPLTEYWVLSSLFECTPGISFTSDSTPLPAACSDSRLAISRRCIVTCGEVCPRTPTPSMAIRRSRSATRTGTSALPGRTHRRSSKNPNACTSKQTLSQPSA